MSSTETTDPGSDTAQHKATRAQLFRFSGWLATLNALFLVLIGLLYLVQTGWPELTVARLYIVSTYTMHFASMAYLPWFFLVVPLLLLWPRLAVVRGLGVVILAVTCSGLLIDALLYLQRQFHINALTLKIMGWHTWAFALFYLLMFGFIGKFLAPALWRRCRQKPARNRGKWIGGLFFISLLTSQLIHAWADANYFTPVTSLNYSLPVYYPLTAKRAMVRYGLVDLERSRERSKLRAVDTRSDSLHYPQAPMQCQLPEKPLNLLIILTDAMRADSLKPDITPNMWQFAQQSSRFSQHYSGGNSSRMGVFSLFYGLPANYWQMFESRQQAPVMMNQLQQAGYALGIYGSGKLYRPASMDRTLFANVPDLRLTTDAEPDIGWRRDEVITEEWQQWLPQQLEQHPQQPFFGFLFYDSPTAKSYPPRMQPLVEQLKADGLSDDKARYQTAVMHVDNQLQSVFEQLQQLDLLDSTVILMSADHGTEFDDSGLGYEGYGNAYTRYQLQVPLALHWPGMKPRPYMHRTSHSDWPVTVMQRLLGCSNPVTDYVTSNGKDLFLEQDWSWMLAGSYYDFALLTQEQVIVNLPNGAMEVRDSDYQPQSNPALDTDMISHALNETTRFFKRKRDPD